jgi:hypothetical protein
VRDHHSGLGKKNSLTGWETSRGMRTEEAKSFVLVPPALTAPYRIQHSAVSSNKENAKHYSMQAKHTWSFGRPIIATGILMQILLLNEQDNSQDQPVLTTSCLLSFEWKTTCGYFHLTLLSDFLCSLSQPIRLCSKYSLSFITSYPHYQNE